MMKNCWKTGAVCFCKDSKQRRPGIGVLLWGSKQSKDDDMGLTRCWFYYRAKELLLLFFALFCVGTILEISQIPNITDPIEPELYDDRPNSLHFHPKLKPVPYFTEIKFEKFILVGLKDLPQMLDTDLPEKKAKFSFSLEPRRINGYNGLLQLRKTQGNSWSGKLMKGGLVIFVYSTVENSLRRKLLRGTWAGVRELCGWRIETVFVVGEKEKKQQDVDDESLQFGDILQYKGEDSSSGATQKVLSAMQWASDNLPGDFFYASAPDHAMVNLPKVVEFVALLVTPRPPYFNPYRYLTKSGSSALSSLSQSLYCMEWLYEERVVMKQHFRWNQQFIRHYYADLWPPHCSSGLYLMPVALTGVLYDISRSTRDLLPPSMHSALISGVLRRKIRREDNNIVGRHIDDVTYVQLHSALPSGAADNANWRNIGIEAIKQARIAWRQWQTNNR